MFTRESVFKSHNAHVWDYGNPHATRPHACDHRLNYYVRVGMVHNYVIGTYILSHHLNVPTYLIFLYQVLPELLAVVLSVCGDVFPSRTIQRYHTLAVMSCFICTLFRPQQGLGRGGSPWPPRSPDLSCMHLFLFLWGHLRSIIYETPVDSDVKLVTRLAIAAGNV